MNKELQYELNKIFAEWTDEKLNKFYANVKYSKKKYSSDVDILYVVKEILESHGAFNEETERNEIG